MITLTYSYAVCCTAWHDGWYVHCGVN